MKTHNTHVIRVKKRSRHHAQGHGGSWKIAYADFMTAMMAFFLVMWLISISSPQELTQIAEYFRTPLKTAINPGSKTGDATNPIPGGGKDIIYSEGDVQPVPQKLTKEQANKNFLQLKRHLEQAILNDPRLNELKPHLLIDLTAEGLRIQIVDSENRPMFMVGSTRVEPYMRDILRAIAPILNDVPNKISISGHTDALQYAGSGRGYSNWELSAERANASRRELVAGGMQEDKILRVLGMASTINLQKDDGYAPINRRISIIVLYQDEAEKILKEYEGSASLEKLKATNQALQLETKREAEQDAKSETKPQAATGTENSKSKNLQDNGSLDKGSQDKSSQESGSPPINNQSPSADKQKSAQGTDAQINGQRTEELKIEYSSTNGSTEPITDKSQHAPIEKSVQPHDLNSGNIGPGNTQSSSQLSGN